MTRQALQYWLNLGCPKEGRGKWDLKKVFDWWRDNIAFDALVRDDETSQNIKREILKVELEHKTIKKDKEKGTLYPRNQVANAWKWRISEVKTGLMALTERLPPVLLGKDQKQMRQIFEKEIWGLLDNYSREGIFCQKQKGGEKSKKKTKGVNHDKKRKESLNKRNN